MKVHHSKFKSAFKSSLGMTLIFALLLTSCKGNLFKDLSGKDTPEALYEEVLKKTDASEFDAAFAQLVDIETRYPDFVSDTFRKTKAGVQAGQCGLNFINLVDGLAHATGTHVFQILMQGFRGVSVRPQKCADAQDTMASLQNTYSDQLLFLAVLGMAKVGSYLRDRADRDGTAGDGSTDSGFDACDPATANDRLNDADMKEVITGFGLVLQNVALIGGEFAGSGAASSIAALNAFCADPNGDGNNSDAINCSITDRSNIDAQTIRIFRRIIQSSQYGVKSCDLTAATLPPDCCPTLAYP